jgi:hypothetical protein
MPHSSLRILVLNTAICSFKRDTISGNDPYQQFECLENISNDAFSKNKSAS